MYTPGIIWIVLFIIGALIIFKFVRKVIKIISYLVLLTVILTVIIGLPTAISIYKDAKDFRKNLADGPKLFVLEEQGMLLTAINQKSDKDTVLLTKEKVTTLKNTYQKDNLDQLLGDNWKIFIFHLNAFDAAQNEIESEDLEESISKESIFKVLKAASPEEVLAAEKGKDFLHDLEKEGEIKQLFFVLLITNAMEQDPLFLLKGINKGEITLYPETAMVKFIKVLPLSFIKSIAGKIVTAKADTEK